MLRIPGLAALAPLMAAAPATAALAQQQFDRPFMMYGYDGFGWSHALVGLSMMVLFWGGLIALFFFVVRWFSGGSQPAAGHQGQKAALSILEERFARGEIANEEFLERKRQLAV